MTETSGRSSSVASFHPGVGRRVIRWGQWFIDGLQCATRAWGMPAVPAETTHGIPPEAREREEERAITPPRRVPCSGDDIARAEFDLCLRTPGRSGRRVRTMDSGRDVGPGRGLASGIADPTRVSEHEVEEALCGGGEFVDGQDHVEQAVGIEVLRGLDAVGKRRP